MDKGKALAHVTATCEALEEAKKARARAFKLAHEDAGCTMREIAAAAGISHPRVLVVLRELEWESAE